MATAPNPAQSTRQRARNIYANEIASRGTACDNRANLANSIRAGFSNIWIDAGIAAIESVIRWDEE